MSITERRWSLIAAHKSQRSDMSTTSKSRRKARCMDGKSAEGNVGCDGILKGILNSSENMRGQSTRCSVSQWCFRISTLQNGTKFCYSSNLLQYMVAAECHLAIIHKRHTVADVKMMLRRPRNRMPKTQIKRLSSLRRSWRANWVQRWGVRSTHRRTHTRTIAHIHRPAIWSPWSTRWPPFTISRLPANNVSTTVHATTHALSQNIRPHSSEVNMRTPTLVPRLVKLMGEEWMHS